MNIKVSSQDVTKTSADVLVVNVFAGVKKPTGATGTIDQALNGAISRLIADGEITGKRGEWTLIHTFGRITPARVAVLGLGKSRNLSKDSIRSLMAQAARALNNINAKRAATIVHGAGTGGLAPNDASQAIAEGVLLGTYRFDKYKRTGKSANAGLRELVILEHDRHRTTAARKGIETGRTIAECVILTRDMINEPANHMRPSDMAMTAQRIGRETGIEVEVFDRDDMERMKMGALLGVARGSAQPPKFIIMRYRGDPDTDKTIGLVGKGVTFDTGGISLKPAGGMGEMKTDMSGGATVIGAMRAIALLKPPVNVTGLVPATENMPSSTAQKPGDLVTAMNGKTIEVDNTDAEGRLILADALSYGRTVGLSPMIDIATLTGAVKMALGSVCTGAFTNHQPTMNRLLKAAAVTGEKIWQLPMYDEYKEMNRSEVADVKNTGGRFAGAITAAFFLREFSESTPWVHLDIAGTARMDSTKGYNVKGASGAPLRTLVQFVLDSARGR